MQKATLEMLSIIRGGANYGADGPLAAPAGPKGPPGSSPAATSPRHSQALLVPVDQGLEQGLVLRDGLQDAPVLGHVADGPLAQPGAAESENIAGKERRAV